MTDLEAISLLRALVPVGGVCPEMDPEKYRLQCENLRKHLEEQGAYVPKWLKTAT